MFAFAPGSIFVIAVEADFDAHSAQFADEGFGFGEMAADVDLLGLEEDHESGDEVALGNSPVVGFAALAVAAGDGDGQGSLARLNMSRTGLPTPVASRTSVAPLSSGRWTRSRTCSTTSG